MKTKIWLLANCILFCNCYSYRTMNTEIRKIEVGKKYKIVTANNQKHKITLLKSGDTLVGRKSKSSGTLVKLAKEDVRVIKEQKFSVLKTIGLPVIIGSITMGVGAITGGPNLNIDPGL